MVWSGSRVACLPLLFICLPVLFICLPGWVLVVGFPAGCLPLLFICLPSWVLVVGFRAGLSPTSFHLFPTSSFVSHFFSFVSQAGCLWSGSRLACLPFHLFPTSFHLFPKLAACGRVPGWLVSHFLSFVSHFFSFVSQAGCLWSGSRLACLPLPFHFFSFVSQFFSFVRAGCLWSGLRLACLPRPFICIPLLSFVSHFFSLSPRLGACGRVPSRLVSHFFSFVSQAGRLWSGSWLACLPLPFILSPTSFHLSPTHPRNRPSLQAQRVSSPGRGPPVKGSRPFERGA